MNAHRSLCFLQYALLELCRYLHIKYISGSKPRISGKSFPGKLITQDAMSLIK